MKLSILRNSCSISIRFDADKAANLTAILAGRTVRNATKSVLESAIANTRSAISAERAAKDAIWNVISTTAQITEAVVHSTDVRVEAVVEEKVIAPAMQATTAITTPTRKVWNLALDGITDYLESTPIKTAKVTESFPIQVNQVAEAIADCTQIEESEAIAEEVDPIATQNEINAAFVEEKPQVIDGSLVSSAGVIPAIEVAEAVKEVEAKASHLSALIRDEVAKR